MAVYNITKVINKSLLSSIKKYLNANKVTILYSDWGIKFGVRTDSTNKNKNKLQIVSKVLWRKLCSEPITKFTSCPKVDVHNASLIRQYGRYSNVK